MTAKAVEAYSTVDDVLRRWPETALVFIRHRMACVGCVMAPFETIADVATVYRIPLDFFLDDLRGVVRLREA